MPNYQQEGLLFVAGLTRASRIRFFWTFLALLLLLGLGALSLNPQDGSYGILLWATIGLLGFLLLISFAFLCTGTHIVLEAQSLSIRVFSLRGRYRREIPYQLIRGVEVGPQDICGWVSQLPETREQAEGLLTGGSSLCLLLADGRLVYVSALNPEYVCVQLKSRLPFSAGRS